MKTIISILVIIVLVLGVVFFFTNSQETEQETVDHDEVRSEVSPTEEEDTMMENGMDQGADLNSIENSNDVVPAGSGFYEEYSSEKLARAEDGNVVLFFHAAWCPTCKTLDRDIKANLDNIPADLSILTLDYDSETELKRKYKVTYQHTLVQVDQNGDLIKRWSGSPTLATVLSQVQN